MKKAILVVMLSLACAMPAAAKGPYIGFGGGLSITHDSDIEYAGVAGTSTLEYDPSFGVNVMAGYDFDPIRVEAEFSYREANGDKFDNINVSGLELSTKAFMVNAYYDSKTTEYPLKPYFGVGAGIIKGEIEENGESIDDTDFGYQLTLGLTSTLSKQLDLDLYYRFQATPNGIEEDGVEVSYNNSSFFVGLRYNF